LRLYFRRAAHLEYDEAANWYESQRRGLGAEFVHEIERALLKASEVPQSFPRVLADIRRVSVQRFPYSIFFRVRHDRFIVLAVFHVRRDPAAWRERA
jgi:plasmid stabilization system protein ParE